MSANGVPIDPLRPKVDVDIYVGESAGEDDDVMGGECAKVNVKRGPREPSIEERRNHEVLHLPDRS